MTPRLVDNQCCRACIARVKLLRFSTSASSYARIPPESPRFIEVPRPVQPVQPFPIHIKGVLPVPRSIFRRHLRPQDRDKASPEYLADVTPEPVIDKTVPVVDGPTAGFVSWKARQAEARRRNLRESLVELNHRKQKTDRYLEARGKRRANERERLLAAPEPEDERLTNPSILQSEKRMLHRILPDPDRAARLTEKRENVARMEMSRQERRQNKLHNLYVNSGNFITTGEQLDATVDVVFDDQDQFTTDQRPGLNVWNLGLPETVSDLLSRANNNSRNQKAMDLADGNAKITKERMRRISEELTGGKMSNYQ
ncbi:hypothetical protein ACLMJK_006134 [Lecanora helva]